MDEVDNIIIHSLRQIGCDVDDDFTGLADLTPEHMVKCVARCLRLIRPDIDVPDHLPPGIAHRYSVTTELAESCAAAGFRGDIGYQTFLYSNVIEVRRVFMFLIERLPKDVDKDQLDDTNLDRKTIAEHDLRQNIRIQLNAAWTPQYCKKYGARKFGNMIAIQASNHWFRPQPLSIPYATASTQPSIIGDYWMKRSPTIFQQTSWDTICASLIHKNDLDVVHASPPLHTKGGTATATPSATDRAARVRANFRKLIQIHRTSVAPASYARKDNMRNVTSVQQLALNNVEIPHQDDIVEMPEIRESDAIRFDIDKIKVDVKNSLQVRQELQARIADHKASEQSCAECLPQLEGEKKMKERTQLLLENPEENMMKLIKILATAQERMKKLQDQWDEHRIPLEQQIQTAQQNNSQYSHTKKIMEHIKATKSETEELAEKLKRKVALHAKLVDEFEKNNRNINRNSYTSRILEIIGNIRKQKTSIDKILNDTRDLQKEINNINGQLDRQFTVTDDLLFKTAKRDEPSKKAYKLLATLHSNCGDLIQMVTETGQVQREIRDLEDQIENERDRNIAGNLNRITNDIKSLECEAADIQEKIALVKQPC